MRLAIKPWKPPAAVGWNPSSGSPAEGPPFLVSAIAVHPQSAGRRTYGDGEAGGRARELRIPTKRRCKKTHTKTARVVVQPPVNFLFLERPMKSLQQA